MLNTNLIQEMNELPELRKIGFIGTGIMGAAMAAHLMEAGFEAVVRDGHGTARNILHELLPRGARLMRGWACHPGSMMAGPAPLWLR